MPLDTFEFMMRSLEPVPQFQKSRTQLGYTKHPERTKPWRDQVRAEAQVKADLHPAGDDEDRLDTGEALPHLLQRLSKDRS